MSDEKRQEAEAITNMKLDAKKLAETLVSCRVVHNKPLHEITNPINDLIKRLASVIQALDVCFKEDDRSSAAPYCMAGIRVLVGAYLPDEEYPVGSRQNVDIVLGESRRILNVDERLFRLAIEEQNFSIIK